MVSMEAIKKSVDEPAIPAAGTPAQTIPQANSQSGSQNLPQGGAQNAGGVSYEQ